MRTSSARSKIRTFFSKASRTDDIFTPGGVLGEATNMAPTQPIKTATGTYFQWTEPLGTNNPLADLAMLSAPLENELLGLSNRSPELTGRLMVHRIGGTRVARSHDLLMDELD